MNLRQCRRRSTLCRRRMRHCMRRQLLSRDQQLRDLDMGFDGGQRCAQFMGSI